MAVTGLITLEEAKAYLRIDGNEEDDLIARLIASSERLCLDILRKEEPEETAAFKMAVLFFGGLSLRAQGGCGLPQSAPYPAFSFVWGTKGSILMKIGKMDKRITLMEPFPTEDGYGGFSTEYKEVGSIWARCSKPTTPSRKPRELP